MPIMAFEIKLRKEALTEIELALDYYLQISPRIAFDFDEELDECFHILSKAPFFEEKISYYRVFPLPKFPYIVIYCIIEEMNLIDIVSVFHTSQDPDKYPQ
jgi:plasmid stabilization system protein ParE